MNLTTLQETLPTLIKCRVPSFLWGAQGIGKTSVVLEVAKDIGYRLVHIHLATQEVGDLIGLLKHNADGTVSHSRPEWFPTTGKCIIFLDEFNQCKNTEVISAMFPFILSGKLHQHQLPPDCYVMAAGNYETTSFDVASMTQNTALMSRFCHLDIVPEPAEWLRYADKKGIDKAIISFIGNHNDMLMAPTEHFSYDFIKFEPRTYAEFLDPVKKQQQSLSVSAFKEIVLGLIGTVAGTKFISHLEEQEKVIDADNVLNQYSRYRQQVIGISTTQADLRLDQLNYLVDQIMDALVEPKFVLSPQAFDNLMLFLNDIPREVTYKACEHICTELYERASKSPERQEVLSEKLMNNAELLKIIDALHKGK